jgi:hypothetical protein
MSFEQFKDGFDCQINIKDFTRYYDELKGIHTPLQSSYALHLFISECGLIDKLNYPLLSQGIALWSTLFTLIHTYIKKNDLKNKQSFKPDFLFYKTFGIGGTFNDIKVKYNSFDINNIHVSYIHMILKLNTFKYDLTAEVKEQLVKEATLLNNVFDTC